MPARILRLRGGGRAATKQNIPVIPALEPTSLTIRQPSPLLPSAYRHLASRLVPHWSFGRARAVPSTVAPRGFCRNATSARGQVGAQSRCSGDAVSAVSIYGRSRQSSYGAIAHAKVRTPFALWARLAKPRPHQVEANRARKG